MLVGLVPARRGSQGIKNKNLMAIGGTPLFLRAANLAATVCDRVIVATDDPQIEGLAALWGFEVWDRPDELNDDSASVDDVVRWAGSKLAAASVVVDGLLVVQPTVPQITEGVLRAFVGDWEDNGGRWPWTLTVEHRHIVWSAGVPLHPRKQRQDGSRWVHDELGVRLYPIEKCDQPPQTEWPITGPVIDIDTPSDLAAVRAETDRRTIVLRFVANERVGMGHLYRCIALAEALQHHDIRFEPTLDTFKEAWDVLERRGWACATGWPVADLYVKDTLDEDWVPLLFGTPWVALEDHGTSARHADLVVNALYPTTGAVNEVSGADWAVLRPEFLYAPPYTVRPNSVTVLVTFGGTDPSGLTHRVLDALRGFGILRVVAPPGSDRFVVIGSKPAVELVSDPSMAAEMLGADLVICSAGRTLFEAASLGVPAVVLSQNPREATHSHIGEGRGNVYLGLGRLVEPSVLRGTVERLLADVGLREDLSEQAKASIDGRGIERICHAVEGILRGL